MGALQTDTALTRTEAGLAGDLSRDWEIWGPNGGYISAIALRAAGAVAPKGHRPASLSVQYVGVADFGAITVEAEPAKSGRSAWLINVRLIQNGRLFLQAQVWTTNRTDGPANLDVARPDVAAPDGLKSMADYLPPDAPVRPFWTNMECRPLDWREQGDPDPRGAALCQWYRFNGFDAAGDPFVDFGRSVVLIDTLIWPTHHRGLSAPVDYIAPSLDLTVWFHEPPGAADWLLADARADVAGQGLIHGRARIWTEDGRLVATGGSNLLHSPRR